MGRGELVCLRKGTGFIKKSNGREPYIPLATPFGLMLILELDDMRPVVMIIGCKPMGIPSQR